MGGFGSDFWWLFSLYRRVSRLTFLNMIVVVFLVNVANISLVLAFFLPLKTIILAGSSGLPDYLNGLMLGFDKSGYVLGFAALSVVFYAVYHFSTLLANRMVASGAQSLVNKARKITVFENQDAFAESVYRRVCNILAAFLFFLAGSLLGFFVDAGLFLFFVSFSVFYFLAFFLILGFFVSADKRDRVVSLVLDVYSGLGFFVLFGFLIFEYFHDEAFSVFGAIVGLLLIRQIIQRVSGFFGDSFFLLSFKAKINSIFYESLHVICESNSKVDAFWGLASVKERDVWIKGGLKGFVGSGFDFVESKFIQLGVPNVAGFDVHLFDRQGVDVGNYLVKLYGVGKDSACKHEVMLLSEEWSRRLPAPAMVGFGKVGDFNGVFFEKETVRVSDPLSIKLNWYSVLSLLWGVEPEAGLVDQFSRSKPMLVDRLSDDMILRLQNVVGDGPESTLVEEFKEKLPSVRRLISNVPLCVFNPDIHMGAVHELEREGFVVYNWGRWAIEPVGAGWPTGVQDIKVIEDYLCSARVNRSALESVGSDQVALVAVMYAMDVQYSRQNYLSVIEAIPVVLSFLEKAARDF